MADDVDSQLMTFELDDCVWWQWLDCSLWGPFQLSGKPWSPDLVEPVTALLLLHVLDRIGCRDNTGSGKVSEDWPDAEVVVAMSVSDEYGRKYFIWNVSLNPGS